MKLFIVESPGKIKKIQGFLGPSYNVMASVGHVRDLPEHDFGVVRQEKKKFEPSGFKCSCGKDLIRRKGTSQKTGKDSDFFACSGFKMGCKATFDPKEDGSPDFDKKKKA